MGDWDRSEKAVDGDSGLDFCPDFQPKKLPSRAPGDLGALASWESSELDESPVKVLCTPFSSSRILGGS